MLFCFKIFTSDRSKNPHKSMLLSVLPALAKKSYIDVGRTPCISDIIGKASKYKDGLVQLSISKKLNKP